MASFHGQGSECFLNWSVPNLDQVTNIFFEMSQRPAPVREGMRTIGR